jgi:hypothetical protein
MPGSALRRFDTMSFARWTAAALRGAALLAIALATIAPAGAQGLIADGKTPDALVLFTGDVIGYIDPCG